MRKRLLFLTLGLALAYGLMWQTQPGPAYSATAVGLQQDFIRVAEMVMPSVVSLKAVRVVTVQPSGPSEDFFQGTPFEGYFREFGPSQQPVRRRQVGQGSGIIVDARGYILTNYHVVAGSQQILVRLNDGREVTGRAIGGNQRFDLALVQVQAQGLKPAILGDSSKIHVGQWAIAIGSPFGLEQTMTVGIISATGRRGLGKRMLPSTPATVAAPCWTLTATWSASTA
jgi:serine protease Do